MGSFSLSGLFLGVFLLGLAEKIFGFFGSSCVRLRTACFRVYHIKIAAICGVFAGIGLNGRRSSNVLFVLISQYSEVEISALMA
jgi:hypothetical protein